MEPAIGQIVLYELTDNDAVMVNMRRNAHKVNTQLMKDGELAYVKGGDVVPAIVTKVHEDDRINAHVLLDGWDSFFILKASQGHVAGTWRPRE